MEIRDGIRGTLFDGIFFTEDPALHCRLTKKLLKVEISRQNASLQQVKKRLARLARDAGGNALVGFTYGQRSHSIWQQLFTFKWDTESWHGQGYAAAIDHAGGGNQPNDKV
jgi:hypothetical protein